MVRFRVDPVGNRSILITHPDGHRWSFQFPPGWVSGKVPEFEPVRWARGKQPQDDLIARRAMKAAVDEAKLKGWIGA